MADPDDEQVDGEEGGGFLSINVSSEQESLSLSNGQVTYNGNVEEEEPLDWGDKYLWPTKKEKGAE